MTLTKLDTQSRDRHGMFIPHRLEATITTSAVVVIEIWSKQRRCVDFSMSRQNANEFAGLLIALDATGEQGGEALLALVRGVIEAMLAAGIPRAELLECFTAALGEDA